MQSPPAIDSLLAKLNPQQRQAATHGDGPLLIVAGAGTGKTATLVHRVVWLIARGVEPSRILLLTFTRRAAAEMLRRVDHLLRQLNQEQRAAAEGDRAAEGDSPVFVERKLGQSPTTAAVRSLRGARVWGGTFHAIATRLLRRHGKAIGLPPEFTIHDRADSEDLLNVVRSELGLAKTDQRFPKKGTCMAIYSRCVNARESLEHVLQQQFPWCGQWAAELKRLLDAYVDRKEAAAVLDYDDLLVYWHALLADPQTGPLVRKQFDCVLVDEYQDTNVLQAELLGLLSPAGQGLTVVGDDAQSIYSFRAATVRNMLDFPKRYPDATIVTLEQNYRSTCPILEATNQVIGLARERYRKNLWSERLEGQRPALVTCEDENDQTEYVIRRILEHREQGIELRRQAVLFRASHHSMLLEAELSGRKIPFYKYGGLKFVETAHVKDLMAFLRLAENPRDVVSGARLLLLLPGIGPGKARQLMEMLVQAGGDFSVWAAWKPPAAAAALWPKLVQLLQSLAATREDLPAQLHRVRLFYGPLLETLYDHVQPRLRDLEQLEQIAGRYRNRRRMLREMALDPPNSTQDLAGPPQLDDDYLVLSTIHSAKGLEWDAVYVIHAADGNIPSDMATKDAAEIEEERRLFYVALTRAKNYLYVCCPLRYYHAQRPGASDFHGYAQRTRFLPESLLQHFDQCLGQALDDADATDVDFKSDLTSQAIRRRTKDLWR
jgi:DNA helicase-2/ATP-dependent DNA helicase PcrA